MLDYQVWCPSYKRPKKVKSHLLFPEDKFFYVIHEEEEHLYRKTWPNLQVIPRGMTGSIARARNWILNNNTNRWLIQVDDDLSAINWTHQRDKRKLTVEELDDVVLDHFQLCEDADIKMWGMNLIVDPKAYRQYNPYSFDAPVLGTFTATLDLDLRYDEDLPLKEDYDLFLQVINKYGRALRANFLNYSCDHLDMSGGCQEYRTKEFEDSQKDALQKKWGSKLVRYNERNPDSTNMRIRI